MKPRRTHLKAFNAPPVYVGDTRYDQAAVSRGAADFDRGSHLNPFESNSKQFRSWIFGYTTARQLKEIK